MLVSCQTQNRPVVIIKSVIRQWDETYSCNGSRQTLTSSSDSVMCLSRTAHASFLSDTKLCGDDVKVGLSYYCGTKHT